jgi:hypothetical protein
MRLKMIGESPQLHIAGFTGKQSKPRMTGAWLVGKDAQVDIIEEQAMIICLLIYGLLGPKKLQKIIRCAASLRPGRRIANGNKNRQQAS